MLFIGIPKLCNRSKEFFINDKNQIFKIINYKINKFSSILAQYFKLID